MNIIMSFNSLDSLTKREVSLTYRHGFKVGVAFMEYKFVNKRWSQISQSSDKFVSLKKGHALYLY